jgi:hypothetical protein
MAMTERETRTALPSTPVVAHRGWVKPMPRRSRLEYVIWAAAILFGSTIGGTLALRAEPAPSKRAAVQPAGGGAGAAPSNPAGDSSASINRPAASSTSNPGGGTATNAAGGAATANPVAANSASPAPAGVATVETAARAAAVGQISDALRRFVSWSRSHPGARCPEAVALGAPPDPWGHALRVTCTDQPADQIAGVVSAGPDGVAGTRDDIESWTLGTAVTDLARGPRWRARRSGSPQPAPTIQSKKLPASPGAGSSDHDGDGIPDRR